MATDPQSLEETAKAHVSSTVTKLIQATTANTKAELPLHSIVAASLSKQHELVSTLATQIADQVEPAQRDAINALVTQNKDIAESVTKQITIFTQDDLGISLFADEKSLISPLYKEPENDPVQYISDNQAKSVPFFSGDGVTGPQLDEILETFLSTAFRVASQNNLAYATAADMIKRKLQGTSKLLLKSFCDENSLEEDDIQLVQLCHFLESRFALFSSPKNASLALTTLPKIQGNQYLAHVGKITRLTRLATRFITDKTQKDIMISTRGLEAFKACLSENDRNYLISQERLRTQNQQQPLTLHKSAELLTTRYAEAQQTKIPTSTPVFQADNLEQLEVQEEFFPDSNEAYFAPQRGNFRGNRPTRGPPRGGGYPNNGRPQPDNRFQGNPQRGQQGNYNRGYQRDNNPRGYQRDNNPRGYQRENNQRGYQRDNNPRGGVPRYPSGGQQRDNQRYPRNPNNNYNPNQYQRNRYQTPRKQELVGPNRRPDITAQQLNVSPSNCKSCNKPGHSYTSPICIYYGRSQLHEVPCETCKHGGHHWKVCQYRDTGATNRRTNRRVTQEEHGQADSDDEIDDFFSTLSMGKN